MITENLYQPFEIECKTLDKFPQTAHQHNFFELVYIVEGNGRQYINDNKFDYRKGNLFLITPQDSHFFEVTTTTQFFFIRFNEIYVKTQKTKNHENSDWIQRMEFILENASHQPGCILKNQVDKPLIRALMESMIREQANQQLYYHKIIQQIVNTILTIVARNIALILPEPIKENEGEAVLDILHYIQQHIYEPEMLKAKQISKQFGISLSYLGRYFKKHTGQSMQQYITYYRLRLIETRLLYSNMRINEIAYELNFTDESHLNKIFKKYKGMNPSEFRKKCAQAPALKP